MMRRYKCWIMRKGKLAGSSFPCENSVPIGKAICALRLCRLLARSSSLETKLGKNAISYSIRES